MSRAPFLNWKAMAAVMEYARQHQEVSPADFRLLMEVAARTDPDTGEARVSVRTLAAAVHHDDPAATRRRLRALEAAGWLERQGTGQPGRANLRNTETYRLTGAVTASVGGVRTGAATAPVRGAATAPVIDRDTRQLTAQQRLAMRTAPLNLAAAERPPNGTARHSASGGLASGSPHDPAQEGHQGTPEAPTGEPAQPLSSAFAADASHPSHQEDQPTTPGLPGEPWDQGKQNGAPGPRPVPGRSANGHAPGGAPRPQSREPLGDATDDPVLHPGEGRSDDLDVRTESDTAFWTAGEHTVWEFAPEMEAGAFDESAEGLAELFELAHYRDPRRHAR
jgi:MarR family